MLSGGVGKIRHEGVQPTCAVMNGFELRPPTAGLATRHQRVARFRDLTKRHSKRRGARGDGVGVRAIGHDTALNELGGCRVADKLRVVSEQLREVHFAHIGALVRREVRGVGHHGLDTDLDGLVGETGHFILDGVDGDEVEGGRGGVVGVRHVVFRVPFDDQTIPQTNRILEVFFYPTFGYERGYVCEHQG